MSSGKSNRKPKNVEILEEDSKLAASLGLKISIRTDWESIPVHPHVGPVVSICCGCGKEKILRWEHGNLSKDSWCKFKDHIYDGSPCQICDDCYQRKEKL